MQFMQDHILVYQTFCLLLDNGAANEPNDQERQSHREHQTKFLPLEISRTQCNQRCLVGPLKAWGHTRGKD